MSSEHPAVQIVLRESKSEELSDIDPSSDSSPYRTSVSLARALAVGCLSRLNPSLTSVNIWDPAAGFGYAGHLLVSALETAGVKTLYRGQDINKPSVDRCRRRFDGAADAEVALGNTLERDAYEGFEADLVVVDAPWGMNWRKSERAVAARRDSGTFRFGLPQRSDSTWLFISLAIEKLRPAAAGGGRVAALVNPSALSADGKSADIRRSIVDAGLLESVTRLPDGLAPNTGIPLYLVTFASGSGSAGRDTLKVADLQTEFATNRGQRSMPVSAFEELESALRTGKAGPRNRRIAVRQLIRREARLSRGSSAGQRLSWRLTTYKDTAINEHLIKGRYGPGSRVTVDTGVREILDLDPSRIFVDDSRDLLKDLGSKGWPGRRLSGFLREPPHAVTEEIGEAAEGQLFIPTTRAGRVSAQRSDTEAAGRHLSIQLDGNLIQPSFLAGWLNSEQGVFSRRRAIEASSSGTYVKALRSDLSALMRWADELIIPVPELTTQLALASADEQMSSFQAELSSQRESIWLAPEGAEEVVNRLAPAFDDSLSAWLDQLPFPIASALWTAETEGSPGDQQRAYIHAWEAIVTFHATVLLSAMRSNPGGSSRAEAAIRETLHEQHLGIERASFGTWVVIFERTSKDVRRTLESDDADEVARIRRAFGDLGRTGIERLVSKDVVNKFKELNVKRNRWLGHTGYISEQELRSQVVSLISDLRELRQLLGNVWAQLILVRAGSGKRGRDGLRQSAEVALGTRSPFATKVFSVGDLMVDGELYLVKDGSQSPLRLGQFVQLRAAPLTAQYTSYFYNRTEGASVRMVSYQYGPETELRDDLEGFLDEFGGLT